MIWDPFTAVHYHFNETFCNILCYQPSQDCLNVLKVYSDHSVMKDKMFPVEKHVVLLGRCGSLPEQRLLVFCVDTLSDADEIQK